MLTGASQTFKFDKVNPQIRTFIPNSKLIYIHENANREITAWEVIKMAFQQLGTIIAASCKLLPTDRSSNEAKNRPTYFYRSYTICGWEMWLFLLIGK